MTRLIIAEKPDMGRKIASALAKPHKSGNGYIETAEGIVTWCIGHIMRSYQPDEYNPAWKAWNMESLPMLIDTWQIKVETSKAAQFKVIKELLGKVDEIVNAGDPGREGQLIVDEVLHFLKNKKPVKRILLYALDQKSIKQAFANLEDNQKFFPLYEAGICRGYADWLMGMNATRAYTLLAQKNGYKGVLTVGRVQSPTLAIVVRRDEEIDNFVPHDFYTIIGTFQHQHTPFNAYWKPQDSTNPAWLDQEKRLIDKNAATSIANKVKGKPGIIKDYEEKDGKEGAPLPFNLSKMQIYANAKWGMSAKDVLDTCQALYEKHELQTYPRTDCQFLPENLFSEAPIILAHVGQSHPHLATATAGANPNLKSNAWDDTKLGEHYGLIPTKKQADLSQLSDKEKKIYQAVCERYIAQFYPACEFRTAVVTVECENEIFKANGKVISELGWRKIFNNEEEAEEKKDGDDEEQVFPEMKQGQNVLCQNSKLSEKKTTPPTRYTEGTLIKAMTNVHTLVSDPEQKKKLKEKKGIGQEATRTQILENLFKRLLLTRQGKQIISSSAGRELVKVLPKKVTDPALTAVWEDALDKIASGKMTSELFRQKQNEWVIKLVAEAKTTQMGTITQVAAPAGKGKTSVSNTGYKKPATAGKAPAKAPKTKGGCPVCKEGTMTEKVAKASGKKFLGCSNWPKCNHVEWPKK
jgi:DNA topoisomerase-3